MRVSTQTSESIVKSRSFFAFFMLSGLVAFLSPVGIETIAAQTYHQPAEVESFPQSSEISAGANGTASIDFPSDSPAQVEMEAGSDSEPLPESPAAPQSILVPQTPTAETFTETNSDGGIGSDTVRLPGDGSQAIGTFATQNPFVRQPGQTTMPSSPSAM